MARSRSNKQAHKEAESGDFSEQLVTVLDPTGAASEAYRTLRTNLIYSLGDLPLRVVVLTSAGPQEGKSTTCANLAVVLAQAGKRVMLVDCDLRKPVLHKIFELRNFRGVVNVLAGEVGLQEVWQEPIMLDELKVVTTGPIPPNPTELLGSRRFAELLKGARQEFDFVLIDAPPIQLVSDPAILASQGDGVLLVIDAQNTRKASVRQAVRGLETVGARVIGTVMNNAKTTKGGYYYGGYTYGGGSDG